MARRFTLYSIGWWLNGPKVYTVQYRLVLVVGMARRFTLYSIGWWLNGPKVYTVQYRLVVEWPEGLHCTVQAGG